MRKTAPILTQLKQWVEVASMLLCNIKLTSKQSVWSQQYLFNHSKNQMHEKARFNLLNSLKNRQTALRYINSLYWGDDSNGKYLKCVIFCWKISSRTMNEIKFAIFLLHFLSKEITWFRLTRGYFAVNNRLFAQATIFMFVIICRNGREQLQFRPVSEFCIKIDLKSFD